MQDDPDSDPWGGQSVFDVYTKSEAEGLDGTKYKDWQEALVRFWDTQIIGKSDDWFFIYFGEPNLLSNGDGPPRQRLVLTGNPEIGSD